MAELKWHIELQRLDLKYTWAISRNATDFKVNAFLSVSDGEHTGKGEAAPNVRYGETPENLVEAFTRFQSLQLPYETVEELNALMLSYSLPNALRFGIESAYVRYLSSVNKLSVPEYLGVENPGIRDTAYTIPIMEASQLEAYFEKYQPHRFKYVKLKVNSKNLVKYVTEVRKLCSNTFIIDANEAYTEPGHLLKDLEASKEVNIAFVEQPFPSALAGAYEILKPLSPFPVFADESVTDQADFEKLKIGFHGVNVKLMKAGGYLNGLRLLKEAKNHGFSTMVGCMVETGLGISSGFHLSHLADFLDLDSFLILKDDPYPLVKEQNGRLFLPSSSWEA